MMKKNLYPRLFILLISLFFQGYLFSQCNSVTLTSIALTSTVNNGDGTCDYTVSVSLEVSNSGNASACVEYTTPSGAAQVCWNNGTILVDQSVTITAECELPINLVGHPNPDGGGNACSGALQIPSPPLPVELIHFGGSLERNEVVLEWLTAAEENNDFFEVQHSTDGRNFDPIAKVKGMGTTDLTQNYKYFHTEPSKGNNYYRLKQVDYDGEYEFFDIVVVKVKSLDVVSVYPSQVFDVITLELPDYSDRDMDVKIYNSAGVLMKSGFLKSGDHKVSFQVSDFPSGVYFIRYVNEELDYSSKQFFKMRD